MGLIHLYCGDGKGKTTAALGLAVRTAGCGGQAVAARFLKNDASGEVEALRRLGGVTVFPCKRTFGFTWQMGAQERAGAASWSRELFHAAFEEAARLAEERMPEAGARTPVKRPAPEGEETPVLLVLDELCAALNAGLLDLEEVLRALDSRPVGLEVVITGRDPAPELWQRADYVTEMRKARHPFDRGVKARRGIEY
ncbi:cob(I)yrinic acid a,c-diamide adenosyltransferase [Clostridiaceae bacterium]|jgi:cob(I)alamin adenosyltransferase|nr:cob(I)yrinic acid a,c-diamide adenosyltransferase [Clostridium sp.]NBI71455.1 cob(I)yrinic acid a,c-diamide adenosyltransferase [Clostridiaceae bacterium]